MDQRRVVVTGLGCVTSLGLEVQAVWDAVAAGRSGIGPIRRFDASKFATRIGGEVPNWDGGPHLDKREAKRLDRFAQFALNAAIDAVHDAGLDFTKEDPWRCGAIIGSGIGGIEELENGQTRLLQKGPDRLSPFMVPKLMCNAGSGNISIYFHIQGPNLAVASACASAAHAIGDATNLIRHGQADIMVTGGAEAALTPLGVGCFIALQALSVRNDAPEKASRPWDKDRDGFVLSEGSGVLLLEEYEHAKARGARIYAEVVCYGQSADGSHITAPVQDGSGAAHAMELALQDARLNTTDIHYINALGTSTGLGDIAETRAIKKLFGPHAPNVPVSSTKSMTGHLLGASGGIEAIFSIKAIEHGLLPPTINLEHPDAECDLDYVPNVARPVPIRTAMSNSFGFGGHTVALIFAKV